MSQCIDSLRLETVARRLADSKSGAEPSDLGIHLLSDVRELFKRRVQDRLPSAELIEELNSLEERPWQGWFKGKGLNSHALARLLRPFGIQSQNIRWSKEVLKGYLRDSFEDAWKRYL